MIYLKKLKCLRKINIGYNINTSEMLMGVLKNLRSLGFIQCSGVDVLVRDWRNQKRVIENVKKGTRIWLRFVDGNMAKKMEVMDRE